MESVSNLVLHTFKGIQKNGISNSIFKRNVLSQQLTWNNKVSKSFSTLGNKAYQISEIDPSQRMIDIKWEDSHKSKYHYIWLRDNCMCNQCLDKSGQKIFNIVDVNEGIAPVKTSVTHKNNKYSLAMTWSDGHESSFELPWLREHCYSPKPDSKFKKGLWTINELKEIPSFDFNYINKSDEGVYEWLDTINTYGIAMIKGVPTERGTIQKVAEKIAYIRNTMYEPVWNVESKPNANNIAYTSLEVDLHQDLMYYESPPGIQILHCIENDSSIEGGDSLFVDGFKAAEMLRTKDRDAFNTLSTMKTTYHKIGPDHHLTYRRPTISLDEKGEITSLNYSPPFTGPLNIPFKSVEAYYSAMRVFAKVIKDKDLRLIRRAKPGELVAFNNRRILHGRTAFDASQGKRLLQGTYVDLDEFKSRLRVLEKLYQHKNKIK